MAAFEHPPVMMNVFLEGNYIGQVRTEQEAYTLAHQIAGRSGKSGSKKWSIIDTNNVNRGGGTLYCAC